MLNVRMVIVGCSLLGSLLSVTWADETEIATCREHLLKGRYAEARDCLNEHKSRLPDFKTSNDADRRLIEDHYLLLSRLEQAEGNWKQSVTCLNSDELQAMKSSRIIARRGELAYLTGDYKLAEALSLEALELEQRQPLAMLVLGDVKTETGRFKEAETHYRDLVRYYNQAQPTDAETLLTIAEGAARYARWNGSTQIFDFIVNTLCPDALADDKNFWPARHFSGMMFLEKFNEADADSEFESALAINLRSAEIFTVKAQAYLINYEYENAEKSALLALEVNRRYPPALHVLADVEIWRENPLRAREYLDRSLEVNPRDQRTLARMAFCHILSGDWPSVDELENFFDRIEQRDQSRAGEVSTEIAAKEYQQTLWKIAEVNPKPAYACTILGKAFESFRRYPLAELCYVRARAMMPKLSEPKAELAELYIHVGRLDEARLMLDAAFKLDPYHVRISNLRKVLDQLEGYHTITTEHFVIRVDREHDQILGDALAEYLEEIYPELTSALGYEPEVPTQIDVFHNGGGEAGFAWFSARMTGLPFLHTIGASTGKIISFVSPTSMEKPYNWARVVRHEFVHIITLQQTEFGIPHWLTEALAVKYESPVNPPQWQELLRRRVPTDQLFELKNLNDGFQRAKSSDDWQMAYCQSRYYLAFLEENFGERVVPEMLAAYRLSLSAEDVIRKVCGIEMHELEIRFRQYLRDKVERMGSDPYTIKSIAEWEERLKETPDDYDARVNYAHALWIAGQKERSQEELDEVLAENRDHPLAVLFQADIEIENENARAAIELLQPLRDDAKPSLPIWERLIQLQLMLEEIDRASELCAQARTLWPDNVSLMKVDLLIAEKLQDDARMKESLEALARHELENTVYNRRLCLLAKERNDDEGVIRHARNVLHVDVLAVDIYPLLGESLMRTGKYAQAAKAYAAGWNLDAENEVLGLHLAECYLHLDRKDDAAHALKELLDIHPKSDKARKMLQQLTEKP